MTTNKEIHIENWRGHGPVTIPAGLRVSKMSYGNEGKYIYFVEEFGRVFDKRTHPIENHDAEYYGLSVDPADVSEDGEGLESVPEGTEPEMERDRR
jgi:hypothetical protein